MKYTYHPVYYDAQEIRYRVVAMNDSEIVYERIFNKEAEAKAYVRKHNK